MGRRKDTANRIAAPHRNGISHLDLRVMGEVFPFLRSQGEGVHVTIALHDLPEHERHSIFDKIKGRVATYQKRAGMKRVYWITIRETITDRGYSLHLHLLCVFPNKDWAIKFTESLNHSTAFRRLGEKAVKAVYIADKTHWDRFDDHRGQSYFTQETTIQAWDSVNRCFVKPRHPETGKASFPLDSDRVGVSKDVKEWLVRTGRAKDWTRTNAKRTAPEATGSANTKAAA